MAELSIRYAHPQDEAEWRRLWLDYTSLYESPIITEEVTRYTWARILDEKNSLNCIVGELDSQIVGIIHFILHPRAWSLRDACYMEDLYIDVPHRRRNIATAMVGALKKFCENNNISRLYWQTHDDNEASNLYDRLAPRDTMLRYVINLPE